MTSIEIEIPGLGILRGTQSNGVAEFLNVPYGILKQRFALPVLAVGNGLIDCTRQGPLCPQLRPFDDDYNGVPTSECAPLDIRYDELKCLNMRMCIPLCALKKTQSVPVVVWLHGGSNIAGSPYRGSSRGSDWIRQSTEQERPFILLTPHYRVGIFGWLPTEFSTNQAIADQRMALQWVHAYGEYIGADRNRVSLIGQSSGASDVYAHLRDTQSVQYCSQFALLSGNYTPASRRDYNLLTQTVCQHLGCDIKELSTIDSQKIVDAQVELGINIFPPVETEEAGNLHGCRVIISDCADDGAFIASIDTAKAEWDRLHLTSNLESPEKFFSELVFGSSARKAAHELSMRGARVLRQLCDATNPYTPSLGNNHMVELHYIIHGYSNTDPKFDAEIRAVQTAWSRLVYSEDVWQPGEVYYLPPDGRLPYILPISQTRAKIDKRHDDDDKMMYADLYNIIRGWPILGQQINRNDGKGTE